MEEESSPGADIRLVQGKIIRKKKRPDGWVLSIKPTTSEDALSIPVHVPLDHPYDFLVLFAVIAVQCRPKEQEKACWRMEVVDNDNDNNAITLIQCAPYPAAMATVLQGIVQGKYPYTVIPSLTSTNDAQRILAMPTGRAKRLVVAEMIRVLEGRVAYKPPRLRPPYVKQKEWQLLEDLERIGTTGEQGWTIQTIEHKDYSDMYNEKTDDGNDDDDDNDNHDNNNDNDNNNVDAFAEMPLNIPVGEEMIVGKGARTRTDYIRNKKIPQVRWMVNRIKDLYNHHHHNHHQQQKADDEYDDQSFPKHILDVGGGRGDLATALARAFPTTMITVVDVNEPSLEAGKEYAQSIGCGDQINFVLADMVEYAEEQVAAANDDDEDDSSSPTNPHPRIDLVVALHACGDLSDYAMTFASRINAAFVVCPCCYAKRKIPDFVPAWVHFCNDEAQTTLRRLCELNEKPEVSRRSMTYINSMRHKGIQDEYCISLEQYDIACSTRNHVFVGTR